MSSNNEPEIEAHRIAKPIQLLAAWLDLPITIAVGRLLPAVIAIHFFGAGIAHGKEFEDLRLRISNSWAQVTAPPGTHPFEIGPIKEAAFRIIFLINASPAFIEHELKWYQTNAVLSTNFFVPLSSYEKRVIEMLTQTLIERHDTSNLIELIACNPVSHVGGKPMVKVLVEKWKPEDIIVVFEAHSRAKNFAAKKYLEAIMRDAFAGGYKWETEPSELLSWRAFVETNRGGLGINLLYGSDGQRPLTQEEPAKLFFRLADR